MFPELCEKEWRLEGLCFMHKSSPRFLGYFIPGNLYKKIVLNVLHDSGYYQSELRHLHNEAQKRSLQL